MNALDSVALVLGYLTLVSIVLCAGWCLLIEGVRWRQRVQRARRLSRAAVIDMSVRRSA